MDFVHMYVMIVMRIEDRWSKRQDFDWMLQCIGPQTVIFSWMWIIYIVDAPTAMCDEIGIRRAFM